MRSQVVIVTHGFRVKVWTIQMRKRQQLPFMKLLNLPFLFLMEFVQSLLLFGLRFSHTPVKNRLYMFPMHSRQMVTERMMCFTCVVKLSRNLFLESTIDGVRRYLSQQICIRDGTELLEEKH